MWFFLVASAVLVLKAVYTNDMKEDSSPGLTRAPTIRMQLTIHIKDRIAL